MKAAREAVRRAIAVTHTHPDAIDGATMIASAIALCLSLDPATFDGASLIQHLMSTTECEELRTHLAQLAEAYVPVSAREDIDITDQVRRPSNTVLDRAIDSDMNDRADTLYLRLRRQSSSAKGGFLADDADGVFDAAVLFERCQCNWFQNRAVDAVTSVVWLLARHAATPRSCLLRAQLLGGDTDTIGCMLGACLGALHGSEWLSPVWIAALEAGDWGRDGIETLALELHRHWSAGVFASCDAKADVESYVRELAQELTIKLARS